MGLRPPEGRYGDAAAYYSSFGGVWDFFWLLLAITGWHVFSAKYFFTHVEPNDRAWFWLREKFALRDTAVLALYRAYFVYGAARIFAWFIWARVREHAILDWHWGGPYWVPKATTHYGNALGVAERTAIGVSALVATCTLLWFLVGARLWRRAGEPIPPAKRLAPIPQEGWADVGVYLFAWMSLIGLGVWLTTPILNWIVGPAFVVAVVTVVTPWVRRVQYRLLVASQAEAEAQA